MTSWWASDEWRRYEAICHVAISRVEELASATWSTQVIDLTQDKATLWTDLRKSYKSLIHQAEKAYTIREASPLDVVMAARALHWVMADRETRPIESWCLMADWIQAGHAKAFLAEREPGYLVGFVYIYTSGDWAYYGHAACAVPDINHALLWTAIRACKAQGVKLFEVGWQGYAPPTDAKGLGVEFFRRGWGGRSMTFQQLADLLERAPDAVQAEPDVEQQQENAEHEQIHGGRL